MWDGCGGAMPKRGQEMVCNRVSQRCLLRRLHQERSRGHQMVPREPSDITRIGMLGAKRELLAASHTTSTVPACRLAPVLKAIPRPTPACPGPATKVWPDPDILSRDSQLPGRKACGKLSSCAVISFQRIILKHSSNS